MPDSNTTRSAGGKRRIPAAGFLKSIGTERTTVAFLIGIAALLFMFMSIVGAEKTPSIEPVEEPTPVTETDSDAVEVLVAPQNNPANLSE